MENIRRKLAAYKQQIDEQDDIIDSLNAVLAKEKHERDIVN